MPSWSPRTRCYATLGAPRERAAHARVAAVERESFSFRLAARALAARPGRPAVHARRRCSSSCCSRVAGGLLGAWIVLRRLAFFTHAVGSATFPGLVVADAAGLQPAARGPGGRARLRGRRRARRARRARAERGAPALLLVAALAGGVILASDVFDSGAAVDRLLFGTLLGLERRRPRAVGRDGGARGWPRTLALGRAWTAIAFDPDGARALGLPCRRAPTCCCSRSWPSRRWRRCRPWARCS